MPKITRALALALFLFDAPRSHAQRFVLSDSAILTIGGRIEPKEQFAQIAGAARLSNGDIAIVDYGSREIRLFSPRGTFIRDLARAGAGPGELQLLWWFGRSGDSLLTYDFGLSRITTFDVPRGRTSTRILTPKGVPSRVVVVGFLEEGRWLVQTAPRPFPQNHDSGPYRDSALVGILPADSTLPVSFLGQFANLAIFANNPSAGRGQTMFGFDPLVPNSTFLATRKRVFVGDPARDEILMYDASGTQAARIRVPFSRGGYSPSDVNRAKERAIVAAKSDIERSLPGVTFEISNRTGGAPAFTRLIPGASGEVWVESFHVDREVAPEYVVLDSDGRVIARLRGPRGVRFFEFGADYGLGTRQDADDVESVVLYRLKR